MSLLIENRCKCFANGRVYAFTTTDGYPVEVTDTFLPDYTKYATHRHDNALWSSDLADRSHRWMIGVSCMSGCPVRCKFCATGQLSRWRKLSTEEMLAQIDAMLARNPQHDPRDSHEFKINYTRMGEPFLNLRAVRACIDSVAERYPNAHQYVSTIGIAGSDFSWIEGNVTLQISLHSLDIIRRDWLIPYERKMSLYELGQIRTNSLQKTTINLTLVDNVDFNISLLQRWFDPKYFFIKLSPINKNPISEKHHLGEGVIEQQNIL